MSDTFEMLRRRFLVQCVVLIGCLNSYYGTTYSAEKEPQAVINLERDAKVDEHELQLEDVQSADPEADFKHALEKGDYRFVGYWGFILVTPGVEETSRHYVIQYGIKTIDGTSDMIDEKQKRAGEYATQYNKLLLQELEHRSKAQ